MSKIALVESEYTKLKQGLTDVHEDCLDKLLKVIAVVEILNSKEGGFYAKELTPMISDLLDVLKDMGGTMTMIFVEGERVIESFTKVVDTYDILN